jgi:hypothetical protein
VGRIFNASLQVGRAVERVRGMAVGPASPVQPPA